MLRRIFLAGLLALTTPVHATGLITEPSAEVQEQYIQALKTPGHALIMRHALAPGHNDPSTFVLGRCSTQRNLDDVGRAQAVAIGEWLRARGVAPAAVHTSPWCRCVETAELMAMGPVVTERGLRSFAQRLSPKDATLDRLRDFMAENSGSQTPLVMITHSSTIAELIGGLVGSGEGIVVKLLPDGEIKLLGRVLFGQERM
jgi:phosphohistidine phosphatase SixA